MPFEAEIVCDSISPGGIRLTSMCVTYPLCIHNQMLRHRAFSRSTASSRAIPTKRRVEQVQGDPFIPEEWGANRRGMSSGEALPGAKTDYCTSIWLEARNAAVKRAIQLSDAGLHKQWANRLLEPFLWVTEILTATEFANFFWLRCGKHAQPEFQRIARLMCEAYYAHKPEPVTWDQWHLPLVTPRDKGQAIVQFQDDREARLILLQKLSAARCARTSYGRMLEKREWQADIDLADGLARDSHWSPWEHQATPAEYMMSSGGNFRGWTQLRKLMEGENRSRLAATPQEYYDGD